MNDKNKAAPHDFARGSMPRRRPMIGVLKGTFTIDPAWDVTKPAMPEWADLIDEKYGLDVRKTMG